jgi:hypothetical protein
MILILPPVLVCGVNPEQVPCVLNLEMHFFEPISVSQALNSYQIPQSLWMPIIQSLEFKSTSVPERMKQATFDQVPNPIEYPIQKAATAKILKNVLFELFLETMKEYQVDERPTADLIFAFIFSKQLMRWNSCFENTSNQSLIH